jgi:hypothetical protein
MFHFFENVFRKRSLTRKKLIIQVKGKVILVLNYKSATPRRRTGECIYKSAILNLTLDGGEFSASHSCCFIPGKPCKPS